MKALKLFMFLAFCCCFSFSIAAATEEKKEIPPDIKWDEELDPDRSLSNPPTLYRDVCNVYVYSEKQLDNVTIGITDMQGNTYHYEVTTIPAGTYYAVSIDSLPSGQYHFCVYQGSKYVIGMFTID